MISTVAVADQQTGWSELDDGADDSGTSVLDDGAPPGRDRPVGAPTVPGCVQIERSRE
jgi:hypothetical protein